MVGFSNVEYIRAPIDIDDSANWCTISAMDEAMGNGNLPTL